MKKKIKIVGWVLLLALIGIQFIQIDRSNPASDHMNDIFQKHSADDALVVKIKEACYDCHSNYSEYPWYSYIQPLGWWIKGHINNGRKHLNFSEFATFDDEKAQHKLEECVEYVQEGWMPISSFKITHPEARLTDLERSTMVSWFKEQMGSYSVGE